VKIDAGYYRVFYYNIKQENYMFEGKSLISILNSGGGIMYVLILCSVFTVAVIIQKVLMFRRISKSDRNGLLERVKAKVTAGDFDGAQNECLSESSPFSNVLYAGISQHNKSDAAVESAMERRISEEVMKLEEYTGIVGTIGNTAVYIGLFGTVIGIMKAFHDISTMGQGGMNTVIVGVSEALIATAMGLLVAIPSVVAFNYFMTRIDRIMKEMEICASELYDYLKHR